MVGTTLTALYSRWRDLPSDASAVLTLAAIWLVILTVVFVSGRILRRRRAPATVQDEPHTPGVASVEGVEKLRGRIAELERETQEGFNDTIQLTSDLEALQKRYKWLRGIADYEIQHIREFVLVEGCTINSSHLSEGNPCVDFTFSVFNLSAFSVSVPMPKGTVIDGSILFKGHMLSGAAKILENRIDRVGPTDRNTFTIRQWVNPSEAKDIAETLKKLGNRFDFSNAIIYIKNDEFPDAEVAKLDLTLGMQYAGLENKVIQLENVVAAWRRHSGTIEQLNHALGGAYVLYRLFEAREPPSRERIENWFNSSLRGHVHPELLEAINEGMPELTDSPAEQKEYVDRYCSNLRKVIGEERRKLLIACDMD